MFKKSVGMSLAIMALLGNTEAVDLKEMPDFKNSDQDFEDDTGDATMAASIAEAEKEISKNNGEEVSMQKEIKQLED